MYIHDIEDAGGLLIGAKGFVIGPGIMEASPSFKRSRPQHLRGFGWDVEDVRPIGDLSHSDAEELLEFSDIVG